MKERVCEYILIRRELDKLKSKIVTELDKNETEIDADDWIKKYIKKGNYIIEYLYNEPKAHHRHIADVKGFTIFLRGESKPAKYKMVGFLRKRNHRVSCAETFDFPCAQINITKKQIFVYYKHLYKILEKIGKNAKFKEIIKCWEGAE